MSYTKSLKQRPSPMRLIIDEGGDGEAICQCGTRFVWSYAEGKNIIFDGEGAVRIVCPKCRAIE